MRSNQKSHISIILLLSTLWVSTGLAQTRQYRFDHFDLSDGLSQNTVNDIFQDQQGYLWIATQDGLNRFDGYEIKQYLSNRLDTTSLSDNFIWNITEDNYGNLWMCSRNAVNRLNKQTGRFDKFMSDGSASPGTITHLEDQTYLLVGEKLLQLPSNMVQPTAINSLNRLQSVVYDSRLGLAFSMLSIDHGRILLVSEKGFLIYSSEGQNFIPYSLTQGPFVSQDNRILRLDKNNIIVASESGLHRVDLLAKTASPFLENLVDGRVNSMSLGPRGHLWVSSEKGMLIIDYKNQKTKDFAVRGAASDILLNKTAFIIYRDPKNILWIGTANNGFYRYDERLDQFKFMDSQNGLSSEMVWSITEVGENEYWLGTEDGITSLVGRTNQSMTSTLFLTESIAEVKMIRPDLFKGKRINMLYTDQRGNRWVGVHSVGLFILDERNRLVQTLIFNNGDIISNQITSVSELGNEFWVTTFKGVYVVNQKFETSRRFVPKKIETQYFFKAYVDSDELLWLGTNTGFFKYDAEKDIVSHYPYDEDGLNGPGFYFVNDFEEDALGNFWLATYGGGIDFFDRKTETYANFSTQEGLANNVVSFISSDHNGHLWVGTNRGISRFNKSDSSFINFNTEDGLIFNETAINSVYKNQKGEQFFGTAGGLIVFHPDSIAVDYTISPPQFSGIKINYEDVNIDLMDERTIDLYPKDKVISLEFVSLTYRNADRLSYEFMIEGIDDNWVSTDASNRRATYSTLPFGTNRFLVRTRGTTGQVSAISSVDLIVHPPIWLTWWFISLLVVVILALVILSIRAYFKYKLRVNLRELEMKQRVQAERERISRDLHDNVGSQITHIISSLDNLAYQNDQEEVNTNKLEDLSDFTRSTMRFLRETIWVINQDAILISEFLDKVSEYGDKRTEHMDVKFTLKSHGIVDQKLNPTVTMNMFRIIQEAINNALKHASPSLVEIFFSYGINDIHFVVSDNGTGFDGREREGHYGLQNMNERVNEIDGVLTLNSSPEGTKIKVEISTSKIRANAWCAIHP